MRSKYFLLISLLLLVVFFILMPSILQAFVWTWINLLVSIIVTAIFIFLTIIKPKFKWVYIVCSSTIIAIPPYPNWIWASNEKGWHFHLGYKLQNISEYAGGYLMYFVLALVLYLSLFKLIQTIAKNN